jgi:hypothetical protein
MNARTYTMILGGIVLSLILPLAVGTGKATDHSRNAGNDEFGGWRGHCGIMDIIQVQDKTHIGPLTQSSSITDAWTTSTPHSDPWNEVYSFQIGVDTLAFVTEYYFEEGGFIPLQYIRAWDCGTLHTRSTCRYDWTIGPLPPGFTWLLVNYYPPENVPAHPGNYDWATLVGDALFGYPDPMNVRPLCFTLEY